MEHTFGERLKKYRQEKRLTQQELADLLGVSNKTISRWESDGGYPDVAMLVPLARALGVTADDLLDGERPIRTLTKTDWQSLLSFAFALGGGVLFFLLDLFMPGALCYLAYLGCMAYGVYLQKYYTYRSRWFFLANAVMDLSVNLSIAQTLVSALAKLTVTVTLANQGELKTRLLWWLASHTALTAALVFLLAALFTALTQYLVLRWSRGKQGWSADWQLHFGPSACSVRKLLALLIPAAFGAFWLAYGDGEGVPQWALEQQGQLFLLLTALAVLLCLVLFGRRGRGGWLALSLLLTAVCSATGLLAPRDRMLRLNTGKIFAWRENLIYPEEFLRFARGNGGVLAVLAAAAAVWLLLSFFELQKKAGE